MLDARGRLADALKVAHAVLFVGSGLSEFAGHRNRREQVLTLLERLELAPALKSEIAEAMTQTPIDEITEMLISACGRQQVLDSFVGMMTEATASGSVLPPAFRALGSMSFRHAISATVDNLAEAAFEYRKPIIYDGTTTDQGELSAMFADQRMGVIKLFGCLNDKNSIRLDARELARFCYENAFFSKTVASIVSSSPVLFAGMSLSSIDATLGAMPDVAEALSMGGPHIVLARQDARNQGLRASGLTQKYNLELVELPWNHSYAAYNESVGKFLQDLWPPLRSDESMTAPAGRDSSVPISVGPSKRRPGDGHLERICLKDIGPFGNLELDLNAGWTVFLGDNGVGKSTILRAVALALCGSDASRFSDIAKKLIRSSSGDGIGRIDLTIDGTVHRVDLRRTGDSISFKAPTLSVIEQGTKLVLGFPALRGVSIRAGGSERGSHARPDVADVMPLVLGGVDARLDNVRHWLVELEGRAQHAVRDAFFAVVADFLKDQVILRFGEIADSGDVMVWADDELVPLEQLSQGMSSLLAWVGVLIQRLNEVYDDAKDSLKRPALVILDELDAHLHPEWQRQIVPVIRKHLPNVQLIATTHSPLVVSALDSESVLSVVRRGSKIEIMRTEENISGLRADQVLTSDLFGLSSTRSVRHGQKTDELHDLIRKIDPSPEDRRRKTKLTNELELETVLGDSVAERAQYAKQLLELKHVEKVSDDGVTEFDQLFGGTSSS